MEYVHKNSVIVEPTGITINDFLIDDEKLLAYFLELQEKQNLNSSQLSNKIIHLLFLGYLADNSVKIDEKVDYVESSFSKLKQDLQHQIESNFSTSMKDKINAFLGTEGSFTKELMETFGTEGTHSQKIDELMKEYKDQIESLLDNESDDSPFKKLEKSLEEKFNSVSMFMAAQDGMKKVEEKSTQKGAKFEDYVASILADSSQFLNCNFQNTSGIAGISGAKNSKKGDFVLTEKDSGKKIVIEAKNLAKDPTTKQILEYSRIALENRVANYCVYVYSDSDDTTIPEAGMFNELTKDILFVTVSESDTHEAQQRMIRLGCSWALQRIKANNDSDVELNEKLSKLQNTLSTHLGAVKTVKNNSKAITVACSSMIADLEVDLGLKEKKQEKAE